MDSSLKLFFPKQRGTTHIVYATGPGPLRHQSPESIGRLSRWEHGFQRAQLLKPMLPPVKLSSISTHSVEIVVPNITIPQVETTYWCHLVQLPQAFESNTHIVQYEAVIDKRNEAVVSNGHEFGER